jgi:hypothetical protein
VRQGTDELGTQALLESAGVALTVNAQGGLAAMLRGTSSLCLRRYAFYSGLCFSF